MKLSNNKILITGGASGIGLGLTERFIKENNTVIICGRREDVLKEAVNKFPSVIIKQCDLSNEAERIELYNWLATNHSDLNVLVNNAGIQNWMNISDNDFYPKAANEIEINVVAPVHLTNLFINLKSLNTIINVEYNYKRYIWLGVCAVFKNSCVFRYQSIYAFVHTFIAAHVEINQH